MQKCVRETYRKNILNLCQELQNPTTVLFLAVIIQYYLMVKIV